MAIDNVPCQNIQIDTSPSSNAKKSTTISWLNEKRITHLENILRPELYK
jgi:hypothetical protein